ncbi:amidase [Herbaspirillum rhizosphaerae]|uniref:amidase n=1 Tax=Herbaspirillum rhizosphaerae TaxID=346179 RepID=UPI00067E4452|nr:amidase [Herbaspirillum rhizosphaerae]
MNTSVSSQPHEDYARAWVPHGHFVVAGARQGTLAGLRFAVKDVFDVAGHPTGAGNPTWLATHPVPHVTSPIVATLLAAGATLVGKTVTDELAYSIHGDNVHYGTPINTRAPDRVPGGSSSGSVAAVAAGLCDFALGTDTGGSTRVPASYCGVWGLRTTHGLLPRTAMVPLQPSFDTATWFAQDPDVFERVGKALLPASAHDFKRALLLTDVLAQADDVFHDKAENVFNAFDGARTRCTLADADTLESWRQTYVTASAYEGWQVHGKWITENRPGFGPAVAARWQTAAGISADAAAQAVQRRQEIARQVGNFLGQDGVAIIPSAAGVAPLLTAGGAEVDQVRMRTFRITCIAGLAGLPQVSLPFATDAGLPIGVSLLGPAGSDLALIRLATALWKRLQP